MDYIKRLDVILDRLGSQKRSNQDLSRSLSSSQRMAPSQISRVRNRTIAYSDRHRGTWFRPEYDFDEIQIAQDTDSYMFRALSRKVNRVISAGISFTGPNKEVVEYIERRIAAMSWATQVPFEQLIWTSMYDLFSKSNCMWVKKRSSSLSFGKVRKDLSGVDVEPVAGYFLLPFETLEFKVRPNGEFKKVMQRMPDGHLKEFFPRDVIHFHTNRKVGFTVGTPEMMPALDDIALLRRIEENIEDLIESNLFPVFHYKVGSDQFPERYGPDGVKETDVVKSTVEYMPASGIYISDHRHEIKSIGSEGRALRIDFYVEYFKKRVFAALGVSAVDMGEGGSANRSTASTMSKSMLVDIEAMTVVFKTFFDFYVINELLLEGGYNPFDPNHRVSLRFGVIDKAERRADENQQIQMFHANVRTLQEVRSALGDKPFVESDYEDSYFKRFQEPLALAPYVGQGGVAAHTLAEVPGSNITSESIAKATVETSVSRSRESGAGAPPVESAVANRVMPANQHGRRESAKTNRDVQIVDNSGVVYTITCDFDFDPVNIPAWNEMVLTRWNSVGNDTISFATLAQTMAWRLKD